MDVQSINPFVKEPAYYTRNMDIVDGYAKAAAHYCHAKYPQYSLDYCLEYNKQQIKAGGTNELKDPKVMFISQRKRGKREKEGGTFLGLLDEVINDKNLILSPSMIAYERPEVVKSLLSEFQFRNVKKRKEYKNLKFEYENAGNVTLQTFYDILQSSVKELNNSLSGAGVSKFNAIYCKSSHLSLTSGCRTATSYANASNERFIAGNRHYHKPNVVFQELSNALVYGPHKEIASAVAKYNMKYPSVDDVMECILKSSRKYWIDEYQEDVIRDYVESMHDDARAAFVYTGDSYHIEKLNPLLVVDIIEEFVDTARTFTPDEHITEDHLSKLDGDKTITLALLNSHLMAGKKVSELRKKHPEEYKQINTSAVHFDMVINKHEDFIDAFWRPRYLISSIGKFRSIIREAVLTSDTDSTIFTCMYWTNKVTGDLDFSKRSYNVGYVMVYFSSQLVSNALSLLCANLGVGVEQLPMLQMKNEYYFPIYALTNISKHYMALRSAQEGVIKKQMELEMKGVHLISSKASIQFMVDFQEYVEHHILGNLVKDVKLGWHDYMDRPIRQELEIRKNIRMGGVDFYSREQIKNPKDYKQGEDNSNYFQYLMWRECFAEKYGDVENPPLFAMKIPVDLSKKRKLKAWLDNMEDRALAMRLINFLEEKGKDNFTSILIPLQIITHLGLPVELRPIIDETRAVAQIMSPYYVALQSLGYYVGNSKNTRLLTDTYIDKYMRKMASNEESNFKEIA